MRYHLPLLSPHRMRLSIIIPIYGAEAWLDRCIESVVTQSYRDYELLLIDDGSPDSCPQRCDDWAKHDQRIRVCHQPNAGLSAARNTGIDLSQGEYLTFIDPDDYLGAETLEQVMNELQPSYDLLEYPVYRNYGSPRQSLLTFHPQIYDDMQAYWFDCAAYSHTYACNKVYKRTLFEQVRYPVGRIFEDVYALPQLLAQAHRVATTDQGRYYYCDNPQGISSRADGAALRQLLEAHLHSGWVMADDRYYLHVLNTQLDVSARLSEPPLLPPHRISDPLRYKGATRLKAIALNLLGIHRLCRLYTLSYKLSCLFRSSRLSSPTTTKS